LIRLIDIWLLVLIAINSSALERLHYTATMLRCGIDELEIQAFF